MTLRNPAPTGVVMGPLSATFVRRIEFEDVVGQWRAVLGDGGFPGLDCLPFEADTGCVEDATGRLRQLRPDAVAGDQGHALGHEAILATRRAGRGRPADRVPGSPRATGGANPGSPGAGWASITAPGPTLGRRPESEPRTT